MWGSFFNRLKYKITSDSNFVLDFPSEDSLNFYQITKIEPDNLTLIWKEVIYGNSLEEKKIQKKKVIAIRMPHEVFKFSDIRCLGRFAEGYGCYIQSEDELRYFDSFYERGYKYFNDE